jgi:hypothetical protein
LYEFKLILRGSRDGFSPRKFDNRSHTITIIKVKDSNDILGGYNPIIWKSDFGYSITKDSFIFSFKNKENIEDYILSRVKNENFAVFGNSNAGPLFGHDLSLCGSEQGYCKNTGNYDKSIRETKNLSVGGIDRFSVEEYEIFLIMKV